MKKMQRMYMMNCVEVKIASLERLLYFIYNVRWVDPYIVVIRKRSGWAC